MKVRFGSRILLLLASLLLASLVACDEPGDAQPVALPTESPSGRAAEPLSPGDRMAMDEFASQLQTVDEEWDGFQQEFDGWRAGLTPCHRSSVHEALQEFAVGFAGVTEQAGDLPRTTVTRELADILITAAEEEEAAFRQLRDRWQPDNLSLFELVEQRRSDAARAQRNVEDMMLELEEELEKAGDPEEREALKEFSDALDALKDDWDKFHDDYAELQKDARRMEAASVLARLERLVSQFEGIVETAGELPSADATEDMAEALEEAAEAELDALFAVNDALLAQAPPGFPDTGAPRPSPGAAGSSLDLMDAVIEESEDVLKDASRRTKTLVDDDPEENLAEVKEFDDSHKDLLAEWDAFHQRYNDWRKTDGGCGRTEVLQSLDRFNLRMGELGRSVRSLPQSSYLLPMYNLLVEAAAREEGAIRALRNSWRPFTVDAFKAVDQERLNANRLRRQADTGLQELRDRS
ncbi:MAG: hypothetical protein J4F43_05950 [Dehalococcoidia bacterium]|nr:hypothetical protein [Dehalococcoidia bacterium]